MAATLLFLSCGKKPIIPTVNQFINVENGTLLAQNMPVSNMVEIPEVNMNKTVITGGSSYVNIATQNTVKKILVAVKDEDGYFEVAPTAISNNHYSIVIRVNQNISTESKHFVVLIAYEDENGNISEVWQQTEDLIVVGTGTLQVSLSFDQSKDIDLHLFEPNGSHIFFYNKMSDNGGKLDLDSNANCSDPDGINNENITYDKDAFVEPGEYKVYVDMWGNCEPHDNPTHWVLTVFYDGSLLGSKSGTFAADTESNYGNFDNLEPAMTFTIRD